MPAGKFENQTFAQQLLDAVDAAQGLHPGFRPAHSKGLMAGTVLIVSATYYLGASLGLVLKFAAITPSVLWPPNAILTAVLLLAPPRRSSAMPTHAAHSRKGGRA